MTEQQEFEQWWESQTGSSLLFYDEVTEAQWEAWQAAWNRRSPTGGHQDVADRLFAKIAHGSDEHREWLYTELTAFFAKEPTGGPEAEDRYTYGHCRYHKQHGGCHLHNLQCGYPDCDRKESGK